MLILPMNAPYHHQVGTKSAHNGLPPARLKTLLLQLAEQNTELKRVIVAPTAGRLADEPSVPRTEIDLTAPENHRVFRIT